MSGPLWGSSESMDNLLHWMGVGVISSTIKVASTHGFLVLGDWYKVWVYYDLWVQRSKGRFTPRGRVNSMCKRLEILTRDWSKGSNRSQLLYTYRPGRFGGMIFLIKKRMLWHGPSSLNWVHPNWRANSWSRGQCHISLKKSSQIKYDFYSKKDPLDYARFIESTWLLGPKAFTYEKNDPHCNLIIMCS
jgi:hypothetical protein